MLPEAHQGGIAGQDMAFVGPLVFVTSSSDSAHVQKAGWVRDAASLRLLGYFSQNISHAAVIDYSAVSDTLVSGNAGDTDSLPPRIDLLTGFSAYRVNSILDWNDGRSTPRISIPLHVVAADGKTVLRSAFADATQPGASAVWTDGRDTVAIFAGDRTRPLTMVTLRLGRGADDLSATGFGTFVAGRTADEYNGTAALIARYRSSMTGTTQGATWRGGKLFVGWTAASPGARGLEVLELTPVADGTLTLTGRWFAQPDDSGGTKQTYETEAVAFRGDTLLVSGRRLSDNYQTFYAFSDPGTVIELTP